MNPTAIAATRHAKTAAPVRATIGAWLLDGPAFVRELDVSDEEKDMMLAGNAKLLYHID